MFLFSLFFLFLVSFSFLLFLSSIFNNATTKKHTHFRQVTYQALLKAFALSLEEDKYFFSANGTTARFIARGVVFVWTMSYFVVMVIVLLNILINWFFEIYSKHFAEEDELDKVRRYIYFLQLFCNIYIVGFVIFFFCIPFFFYPFLNLLCFSSPSMFSFLQYKY